MSPYFHTVFDQREMREIIEKIILESDSDAPNELSSTFRKIVTKLKEESNLTLEQALNAITIMTKQFNTKMVSQMRQIVRTEIADKFGVMCLSDQPNNALMWGHYAKGHLGFVIEFDEKHSFFNGTSESNIPCLRKVKYSKRKPHRRKLSDLTTNELFFTKSKDWQYEHEWRIMFRLEDAKNIIDHPQLGKIYRFEIPPECIKGIILGSKMSPESIMNLKTNDARYASIKISRAQINDRTYDLDIIDL